IAEFPANEPALSTGSYRLAFDVGGYFGGRHVDSFFNYTAIMATTVTPGEVIGVENDPALGSQARANLMGVEHVTIVVANGADYDPGPVDAILVNAGMTHPRATWLDRLRVGGRMLMPLTNEDGTGMTLKVTREPNGWAAQFVSGLTIFHCVGGRESRVEPTVDGWIRNEGLEVGAIGPTRPPQPRRSLLATYRRSLSLQAGARSQHQSAVMPAPQTFATASYRLLECAGTVFG